MQDILRDFIGEYKSQVDQEIAEEMEKRLAEVREISPHLVPVLEAMKELSVGGKRLRAMLVKLRVLWRSWRWRTSCKYWR